MDWHMLLRYDGADWIAAACSLTSIILLGSKRRVGFVFYVAACLAGLFFTVLARSFPMAVVNLVLIAAGIRGFLRWGK